MRTASILSRYDASGYYLVLVSDMEPRRELSDPEELFGLMMLIREMNNTGRPLLFSHCSSDMILLKAAGASHCATGKFFNLRRFTKSRFDEPGGGGGGGGQLPYWFEQSLLAFLRQPDILRMIDKGFTHLVGHLASSNRWSDKILDQFRTEPDKAWLALGWRQYLSWFGKTESTLSDSNANDIVEQWLKEAEDNWRYLEDNRVLFEEPRNEGSWIRRWRQAHIKYLEKYETP